MHFRNGVVTELDVQQAKTLLNNTQALIPSLEIGLQQAKNALNILLGMPPGNLREILEIPSVIPISMFIPACIIRDTPIIIDKGCWDGIIYKPCNE